MIARDLIVALLLGAVLASMSTCGVECQLLIHTDACVYIENAAVSESVGLETRK
jgi:hypothetical protein